MIKKLLIIMLLATGCLASTWRISAYYPGTSDSIWMILDSNGVKYDSTRYVSTFWDDDIAYPTVGDCTGACDSTPDIDRLEISITVKDSAHHQVVLKNWFTGETRPISWIWERSASIVTSLASGTRILKLYTIDTTDQGNNNADTLANIMIEVVDQTGSRYARTKTNSAGYLPLAVDDNDTFLVYGRQLPEYIFPGEGSAGNQIGYDSIFITNGDTSVAIQGYALGVGSPSAANTTRIYGYAFDSEGNPVKGAVFTAQLNALAPMVRDTCSDFLPVKLFSQVKSDVNGFFYIDLLQNDCISGADTYTFILRPEAGARPTYRIQLAVPNDVGSLDISTQ